MKTWAGGLNAAMDWVGKAEGQERIGREILFWLVFFPFWFLVIGPLYLATCLAIAIGNLVIGPVKGVGDLIRDRWYEEK